MALDYQHITPPAEVRFIEDHNKTKATGPRKAPETASLQNAPTQARAEIRTSQQTTRTKEKVMAVSSLGADTNTNPRARAIQGFTAKSNSRRPAHSAETKTAHPKDYVRNKASDDTFVNQNIDSGEEVENLDEVLGATVNSPAIARRKAKEALAAMEKPDIALEKREKAKRVKPLPIIDPDELITSIRAINALVADIKASAIDTGSFKPANYADIEALELEGNQLQAAADAYDKEELLALKQKYPDSMRKKRAKIVAPSEKEGNAQTSPEELIASIRAILALAEAKEAKTANQPPRKTVADEELEKPEDTKGDE